MRSWRRCWLRWPIHGLEAVQVAVLVAVELALEAGKPSGRACSERTGPRLKGNTVPNNLGDTLARELAQGWPLRLKEEPQANVARYDGLRALHTDTNIDVHTHAQIGEVVGASMEPMP